MYICDEFVDFANLVQKRREIFGAETSIEFIDYELKELGIYQLISDWFYKYIIPIIKENARLKNGDRMNITRLSGFVLQERSKVDNNKLYTFRNYAKNIDQLDNGLVAGKHCDESKWTVDICLGGDFKNGSLEFSFKDNEIVNIKHEIGKMVILLVNTYHCVRGVENGNRINLVIFAN